MLRLIKAAAMMEVVLVRSVTRRWVALLQPQVHLLLVLLHGKAIGLGLKLPLYLVNVIESPVLALAVCLELVRSSTSE